MAENEEKSKLKIVKKTPTPSGLNSNDNSVNVITQVQLKGDNYDEWARAICNSLRARRKWRFATPANDMLYYSYIVDHCPD